MKNWLQAFGSVFAAFLGVQSDENRVRDFQQGRFSVFVVAGITLTVAFLATVYGLVTVVMALVK